MIVVDPRGLAAALDTEPRLELPVALGFEDPDQFDESPALGHVADPDPFPRAVVDVVVQFLVHGFSPSFCISTESFRAIGRIGGGGRSLESEAVVVPWREGDDGSAEKEKSTMGTETRLDGRAVLELLSPDLLGPDFSGRVELIEEAAFRDGR